MKVVKVVMGIIRDMGIMVLIALVVVAFVALIKSW